MFKCFVGLDTELGNMVANHARALEGYFPPAVNFKKVISMGIPNISIVLPVARRTAGSASIGVVLGVGKGPLRGGSNRSSEHQSVL